MTGRKGQLSSLSFLLQVSAAAKHLKKKWHMKIFWSDAPQAELP
jgi:hypothetical protein